MVKKPIRIAQMMTDLNYGGVEMVIMNYYRHIDRTKFQFDFYALEGSTVPQREEIEELGGRVYIVPKYTHLFSYEKVLKNRLKRYKIVHSNMNTLSVFSLYAAKKAGVPIRISHNHSTAGKGEKKNIIKYMLRPFSKLFPTELCACARSSGEWVYGKNSHFKVINNAIDVEKFRYDEEERNKIKRELGIEGKRVIGHIGRFCYQKNHELLIDIFYKLSKRNPDLVLLLIGEGETEQKIREKVDRLGISAKVLFLGRKQDAYRYYNAMDVFLLPSRYEGLPVVGIEAQAAGLPCIFSDMVTKETKIINSTFFVKGGVDNYVRAVEKCLNIGRKNTTEEMKKAGFDIKTEAIKLANYYERLLK